MIAWHPAESNPAADRVDAFVATGTALLVSALAGAGAKAGTDLYAAHKASSSAKDASQLEASSVDKQLAFAREQAEADRAEKARTDQFNLDQYNARESRLAPFRNAGGWANTTLAGLMGGPGAVAAANRPAMPLQLPPMISRPPAGAPPTGSTMRNLVRTPPLNVMQPFGGHPSTMANFIAPFGA